MTFEEALTRTIALLERQGWASYRTLKRRFRLDDATLEALRNELLTVRQLAAEEERARLVWLGDLRPTAESSLIEDEPRSPTPRRSLPADVEPPASPRTDDDRQSRTFLVGREHEMSLFLERWEHVRQGQGQVVALRGEAGIGKTRLLREVKARVADTPHLYWECRCAPYYQHSAFYPLIDLCHRAFRFRAEDEPGVRLRKIESAMQLYDIELSEVVPLYAALLSVPLGDRYPPLALSPEQQRQRTIETVFRLLQLLSVQQPQLFIIEDLQWADPSSLALLEVLVARAATCPVYLLVTCRPEFQAPWLSSGASTQLTLGRLAPAQAAEMATRVARDKRLPPTVLEQIVVKTEGVPLFVEEMTETVLESELLQEGEEIDDLTGQFPELTLPTTLRASLQARLEGLGVAQTVAQVASAWGRAATEAQMQALAPLDGPRLSYALAQLIAAGILREVSLPLQVTYVFKHALIQEAAYASMSDAMRQETHGRLAQVLTERFPNMVETQPELLAHHYTEAGLGTQAIGYWQRAGERAIQRSAHLEAIAHLTKGLDLLATRPDTPGHLRQELTLRLLLATPLMTTQGFASIELEQLHMRARELCEQMGDAPQLFFVLTGLWRLYFTRGELQKTRDLGAQILDQAEQAGDATRLMSAYNTVAASSLFFGEVRQAHAYLEQSLTLYDPQQHRSDAFRFGQDAGVIGHSFMAWDLWVLGYPDQALEHGREALARARELCHPFSQAWALYFAAGLHQLRREAPDAQTRAEAAIELSTEQNFPIWLAVGMIVRGWSLAAQGRGEEGIAQMRQALRMCRNMGSAILQPSSLALLAEAYGNLGRAEEGLTLLDEALAVAETSQEIWWEAELYRRKGELLLQANPRRQPDAAEALFRRALSI
ncbi:MAG: AAA family ATPase, partial [Candidatus Tectomicrobia bacterium]|nr:AAA family ATPase [Candidatus Tectomicrobia bacterium]